MEDKNNSLLKLFGKIETLKGAVGKIIKDKENPFYKSSYTDVNSLLEQLEPLLEEQKLLLIQPIKDNKVFSEIIDLETGQAISSTLTLPEITDPQKIGSAITYYRRYTLTSLLALQSEDDDGNTASGKVVKKEQSDKITKKQIAAVCTIADQLGYLVGQDIEIPDHKPIPVSELTKQEASRFIKKYGKEVDNGKK